MLDSSNILGIIIQIMMAVFGSFARFLSRNEQAALSQSLRNLFVAAFTGMMLYWISGSMDIDSGWLYALSGIAGWAGPGVLDWVTMLVAKKTGIQLAQEPPPPVKPPGVAVCQPNVSDTVQDGSEDKG
jgi:ribose/xylose/arabinose/galactoside ABC-type transport system permease subunit